MKKIFYIFVLACIVEPSFSQNKQVIIGKVFDSVSKQTIDNVSIKINKSIQGTTTNANGLFKLTVNKFPLNITISHVSYQTKTIYLARLIDTLKIDLSQASNSLAEIPIFSKRVINLTKDKPIFVWDFTFQNDDILLLAFRNKNTFHPALFVLKSNGDTLNSTDLNQAKALFKDGLNINHLLTKKQAFQVSYNSKDISFNYATDINDFHKTIDPFVTATENKYYFRQYFYNEQVLVYYCYDTNKDTLQEFYTIENRIGKRMLRDKPRMMSMQGYTETDERFENEFMYKPVFAPLFIINGMVYLFDHDDDNIKIFNKNNEITQEIPINYHNDKTWQKEFVFDEITKKVYAIFKKNGLTSLAEINLENGSIGEKIQIPDFVFVEKIHVNNGFVYFLYKEKTNYEFKQLYKMPVNG
ncbi:MAG: carboxypeptidase-like regulatory domain-containing protein [Bacteroidota bacterium]